MNLRVEASSRITTGTWKLWLVIWQRHDANPWVLLAKSHRLMHRSSSVGEANLSASAPTFASTDTPRANTLTATVSESRQLVRHTPYGPARGHHPCTLGGACLPAPLSPCLTCHLFCAPRHETPRGPASRSPSLTLSPVSPIIPLSLCPVLHAPPQQRTTH